MEEARVNVVLNVVTQVKDAISSISSMQEAFNKLHVPASISTDITKAMTAAKKEATKYLDLINKPITGKTNLGTINRQAEQMMNAVSKMQKVFEKYPEIKLDKMFNISNLPELAKFNTLGNQIKANFAQAFKQGFSELDSFNISGFIEKINSEFKNLDITNEIRKSTKDLGSAFKDLLDKQDLKSYDNFLEKFTNFQHSLVTGSTKIQQAAKPSIDAIQNAIDDFQSKKLGQSGFSFNDFTKQLSDNEAAKVKETAQAVQALSDAMQGAAKTSSGIGINLSNATTQMGEFGKVAQRTAQQTEQFKSRLEWFFGAYNAINLFKRTIRSAFNTIKELDKAMTETAVVTDYTVSDMWKQLSKYTETASSLGATTKGAYETLTLYYQQGLNSTQAMQLGTETMKMARIAGIEYAEATDMMTAALRGFNMALNEDSAQRVNDVYSQLAAKTAASTEEIAVAMTKTASIANSANMDFETTAAFLTQIIETTREAPETAGTAMKTVIARFSEVKKLFSEGSLTGVDEEGEAIDINKIDTALKSVGMSLKKYILGQEGLDDVFLELASKWDTLDMATQRYIATQAAGSRQQSRFIAMMSNYSRTMELVNYAEMSAGAGQEQFEKTLDSMESKLNRLSNAWNDFTLGIANNDAVKSAVSLLTKLLEVINKLTSSFGTIGSISTKVGIGAGIFSIGGKFVQGMSVRRSIAREAASQNMSTQMFLNQPGNEAKKGAYNNAYKIPFMSPNASYQAEMSELTRLKKVREKANQTIKDSTNTMNQYQPQLNKEQVAMTRANKNIDKWNKNLNNVNDQIKKDNKLLKKQNIDQQEKVRLNKEINDLQKEKNNIEKNIKSNQTRLRNAENRYHDVENKYSQAQKDYNEANNQMRSTPSDDELAKREQELAAQRKAQNMRAASMAVNAALLVSGAIVNQINEKQKQEGNYTTKGYETNKGIAEGLNAGGSVGMMATMMGAKGWVGIVAGLIGALITSGIKILDAQIETQKEKDNRLKQQESKSAQNVTDLTSYKETLQTSWEEYKNTTDLLKTLTKGTSEYNAALIKQNSLVLDMVDKHAGLTLEYDNEAKTLSISEKSYEDYLDTISELLKFSQQNQLADAMVSADNQINFLNQNLQGLDFTVANENVKETGKYFAKTDNIWDHIVNTWHWLKGEEIFNVFDTEEDRDNYNKTFKDDEHNLTIDQAKELINPETFSKINAEKSNLELRQANLMSSLAQSKLNLELNIPKDASTIIGDALGQELISNGKLLDLDSEIQKEMEAISAGNIGSMYKAIDAWMEKFGGTREQWVQYFSDKGMLSEDVFRQLATGKVFDTKYEQYSKDILDSYNELKTSNSELAKNLSDYSNLSGEQIQDIIKKNQDSDNKFVKAAIERMTTDQSNAYISLNEILNKYTSQGTQFNNQKLTGNQLESIGTYTQMFGQVFGKDTGLAIRDSMVDAFIKGGNELNNSLQKVFNNLNFSNAISGLKQLEAQIELNVKDEELTNTLKNIQEKAISEIGGHAGILSQLYKNEDFSKVIDGFKKITKAGNEITADAIYDAADGCAILADYLDLDIANADTLARILNDISINHTGIGEYSKTLVEAMDAAEKVNKYMTGSIQHVKNFQQVESDTQVGQFYGSRAKEIQTGFENGTWGDRQLIQSIGQFGSKAAGKYADFMKSFDGGMITRDQLLTQFNKQLGRYNKVFKQVAETGNLGAVWSNLGLFSDIYEKGKKGKLESGSQEKGIYDAFSELVTIKNGQVNLSKQGKDQSFDTITKAIEDMFPDDPEFAKDLITDLIVNSPDMYTKLQEKNAAEGAQYLIDNVNGQPITQGDFDKFLRVYDKYLDDKTKQELKAQRDNAIQLAEGWTKDKTASEQLQTANDALNKVDRYKENNLTNETALTKYLTEQGGLEKLSSARLEKNNEGQYEWINEGLDIDKTIAAFQKLNMTYEEASQAAVQYATENNKVFKQSYDYYDQNGELQHREILGKQGQSIDEFRQQAEAEIKRIDTETFANTLAQSLGTVEVSIDGSPDTLTQTISTVRTTEEANPITIQVDGNVSGLEDAISSVRKGAGGPIREKKRHGQPGARRNAIPGFAEGKQGSRHNYEGIALVGEEGPELVSGDDGMRVVGQNGEELTYVHKEDAIYTNQDTRKLLGGTKSHIPGFAEGNSSLDELIKVLNRLCEELMSMKIRIEYPDQETDDKDKNTGGSNGNNSSSGTNNQTPSLNNNNQFSGRFSKNDNPNATSITDLSEIKSEKDRKAVAMSAANELLGNYKYEGLSNGQIGRASQYDYSNADPGFLEGYTDLLGSLKEDELKAFSKIEEAGDDISEGGKDVLEGGQTVVDGADGIVQATDNQDNTTAPPSTEEGGAASDETEPLEVEATLHGIWGVIDPIEPVPVTLQADATPVTTAANEAIAAVQAADGTTAEFYFHGNKTGEWPGVGVGGAYGSGVGAAFGSALASGSYQSVGGNTLVGEIGQEMVVDPHNGLWYTVGDSGAEFANLPKDAIVFNHKQTEGLLKYGHINNRGHASAFGNAMYTGYTGGTKTRASHNRSGGRGGGGSNKDNEWKNPYDRFYNLIEDIDRELKRQTGIQKKIDKASRDNSLAKNFKEYTTTHKEELKLMQDMTDSYRESMALNKELLEGKEWELQNFMDEHSDMLKYGWYDFDKDEVQMNWDLINSVKDNDTGKKIEEYISGLEKLNDKFWDAAESYDDAAENIRKQVDEARELIQEQREGYLDLEERVIDALIDARQKEIDKLSEISDTLDRDNSDILDSVRDMVDEQRRLRDLQEQQNDLEKKQRRLALLRRDSSGANALEIMQLEEELKNDTRNLTDTLVDEGLDKLEKANEEAQKQRERQIELLSNLLEIDKENGAFNVQAQQLIAGALNNDEDQTLNVFSDMVALLQEAEGWVSKSIFAQQEWIKELKSATFVANQGLEYFLNTQLEDTIISAMEKETARGVGTTVTDLSGNTRTLVNKYSQEDIAAQGEKVKEAYDNAAEARRALQEFEDIDYKDWLTQNGYKNNSAGKAAYQKEYNRLRTSVEEADIEKLNQDRIASAMAKNVLGYVDENGNFVEYVDTSEIDAENHKSQYYYDGKYYDTMTDAQMAKNQALQKSQDDLKDIQKKFNTLEKEYQKALTAMNNAKADYLIAASTSGEDSKAAKSASDTYTKKKKAYDEAYNKYQAQKSLLNSQNEVIEELQYLQIYGPFKQGGLANFTGLAKLDGTPSRPEAILDAKDTKNFIQLKNVLRDLELNGLQGGNTYYEVHIDVDKLESDYDVDKVANRVKELIVSSAQYRNNNTINHLR